MTPYDAWRTNVQDTNEDAWDDAVDQVAGEIADSGERCRNVVSIIANSDGALRWLCGAVTPPDQYLHAFRDLVKLAESLSRDIETEVKNYRDVRE